MHAARTTAAPPRRRSRWWPWSRSRRRRRRSRRRARAGAATPENSRSAERTASGLTPRASAAAAAAIAFSRLWRPADADLVRVHQLPALPDEPAAVQPHVAVESLRRTTPGARCPAARCRAPARRRSGRPRLPALVGEHAAASPPGTPAPCAWRSRWSSEKFRKTAVSGANDVLSSSWKLDASQAITARRVDSAGQRADGRADVARHRHGQPRRPVDGADQLGCRCLAVGPGHRAELVRQQPPADLELSEDLRSQRREHAPRTGRLVRHPGALDERAAAAFLEARSCVPSVSRWTSTPAARSLPAAASASGGRPVSQATHRARPDRASRSASAAATPERARPDDEVRARRKWRPRACHRNAPSTRRCSAGRA